MLHICQPRSAIESGRFLGSSQKTRGNQSEGRASEAVVTLPLAKDPAHLILYDLLTGKETPVSWKRSGGEDHISIAVPLSATPQLLIVR